jgi:hypothetical protein
MSLGALAYYARFLFAYRRALQGLAVGSPSEQVPTPGVEPLRQGPI